METELTKCQETGVILLDKLDKEVDAAKINEIGEAYKFIKEGDAKESEALTHWNEVCMEDEREKARLALEKEKQEAEYKIEKAKIVNERVDRILDTIEKATAGVAIFGVTAVGTKAVIEFEEKGLLQSNPLSKEFIKRAVSEPWNWILKFLKH